MENFRMFICPMPEIEMGMQPTNKYFDTYEECLLFVETELKQWKIGMEEENEYYYDEKINVVFLQIF